MARLHVMNLSYLNSLLAEFMFRTFDLKQAHEVYRDLHSRYPEIDGLQQRTKPDICRYLKIAVRSGILQEENGFWHFLYNPGGEYEIRNGHIVVKEKLRRVQSEETKAKISSANRGKKRTEELKERMRNKALQ